MGFALAFLGIFCIVGFALYCMLSERREAKHLDAAPQFALALPQLDLAEPAPAYAVSGPSIDAAGGWQGNLRAAH